MTSRLRGLGAITCQRYLPGQCPASCATNTDCDRCRAPGETGNYCCISGLCLYMTGACGVTPDGGTPDVATPDAMLPDTGTSPPDTGIPPG